jgi:acetolactate synthase small subunit
MSSNAESVTLDVEAVNHPDVLARIVMLLHRLAIDIPGLTMRPPAQRRRMNLTIEVELRAGDLDGIKANLFKVMPVVSVTCRPQKLEPLPTRHTPARIRP